MGAPKSARSDVAVVGAGIIGTAVALALQADGFGVTLIDPEEPGLGAAAGSAGYLCDSEIFPLARAALLPAIPGMLFDPLGPLAIRLAYTPHLISWGSRFLCAMPSWRVRNAVRALASLNRLALDALFALAARAGAAEFLARDGAIVIFRSEAALSRLRGHLPALEEAGVPSEPCDAGRLRALEPALIDDLAGAIFFPREGRCSDPAAFGRRLVADAVRGGASVVRARATTLACEEDGSWRVHLENRAPLEAQRVVVSAGVWSGNLLRRLGYRVPIETQRGYHLMLPDPGIMPKRVILFGEPHFCATPMTGGLRLAGTVEFAGLDAPPNYRRSDGLFELASRYLPGLSRDGATRWMGFRPSFPDSLPAIGEAWKHRNLYYCFGHERLGLTQAAVSANCLASLVGSRRPELDLRPFGLERFSSEPRRL